MKTRIIFFVMLAVYALSCNRHSHNQEADNDHSHEEAAGLHEEHEESKFQYTAYSNDFEVFAEADPFIVGEKSNVLAHFTHLPVFEPLDSGKVTAVIKVNGSEVAQTLESPTRKGIYSFDIQPETAGKGSLHFIIEQENETYEVQVPEVVVYRAHQEAHEAAEEVHLQNTNTAVFTKEQSWKIDFATEHPQIKPFGQVIKTAALIKPAVASEAVVVAKTGGIVNITSDNLLEGMEVNAGEAIVTVSGSSLAENNLSVRYIEAKNNYDKALAEYERMQTLAEDRIVSQSQLLEARNEFENAKAVFDNLKSNFTSGGQTVTSPMNGYVRQIVYSILIKHGITKNDKK